jgi:hypothetical protein
VEAGDRICVLLGGRTPFVVRATEDGCYRLIGECYLHEMMDGQAMDEFENGNFSLETISIF